MEIISREKETEKMETVNLESLKPEDQLRKIIADLPMLDEVRDFLNIVLVANYNLSKGQNPARVFKVLRIINKWGTDTIKDAREEVVKAIEVAGGALGAAFYEETAETREEGPPEFSASAVNARFTREVDEQTEYSEKAQEMSKTVSNIALALNIPDPTQIPPEPSEPPTLKPNVVSRLTKSLKGLKLPSLFESTKSADDSVAPVGWTTPPVWTQEDLQDFEFIEAVGLALGEEQDKWDALRSYRNDITRDEIEALLKRVAKVAAKQTEQSKAIKEYAEQSRDSFLEMLERLIWIRKMSDSVLSSLSAAA